MQVVHYMKASQASRGNGQDPVALMRVPDEAWVEPGAPLCCTKAALGERPELGKSVRAWWVGLCSSSYRKDKQARQSIPPHSGDRLTYHLYPRHPSKPSHGLHQAESSQQKDHGNPDQLPSPKCGYSCLWLQGVTEPVAAL